MAPVSVILLCIILLDYHYSCSNVYVVFPVVNGGDNFNYFYIIFYKLIICLVCKIVICSRSRRSVKEQERKVQIPHICILSLKIHRNARKSHFTNHHLIISVKLLLFLFTFISSHHFVMKGATFICMNMNYIISELLCTVVQLFSPCTLCCAH